jgi:phage shock protein PspC (stress-responsive transcriptional regulator)
VCGGIAEYFNIDPTLVRLLFVFAALAGGPGLIAYLIMMIVVPEEPSASTQTVEAVAQPVVESTPEEASSPDGE